MEKEMVNTCCICGTQFKGFGNNPWPLSESVDDRCCNDCNLDEVIPARMSNIKAGTRCPYCTNRILYHDKYFLDKYGMCRECFDNNVE